MNKFSKMAKLDQFRNSLVARTFSTGKPIQEQKQSHSLLKCPKGTRDLGPRESSIRRECINKIVSVFKQHGGVQIDTPAFQLKQLLINKYGENSKLIYDLADQGGELCSLRYDLTVPFARFLGMSKIKKIKRFQVGKVYRRDNPIMTKGRFRQFYQCDFDIAGEYDSMIAEAEILKIMHQVITAFDLGTFVIKINSRKLLDKIINQAGIPVQKFKSVCSSIDKLDKCAWSEIKKQLIAQKGLSQEETQKLRVCIELKGPMGEVLQRLAREKVIANAEPQIVQFQLLKNFVQALGIYSQISLDLSLARGLDYYTGLIFEIVLTEGFGAQLGSIAGGGRYDHLIGSLSGNQVQSVGGSIGIERLFSLIQSKQKQSKINQSSVLVASVGKNMAAQRMKILKVLWQNGISAQHIFSQSPKPQKQLSQAFDELIPMIIWVGEDEIKMNKFKLKVLYKGLTVEGSLGELIEVIKGEERQFRKALEKGQVKFQKEEKKKK